MKIDEYSKKILVLIFLCALILGVIVYFFMINYTKVAEYKYNMEFQKYDVENSINLSDTNIVNNYVSDN